MPTLTFEDFQRRLRPEELPRAKELWNKAIEEEKAEQEFYQREFQEALDSNDLMHMNGVSWSDFFWSGI